MFEQAQNLALIGIDPGLRTCGIAVAYLRKGTNGWLLAAPATVHEYSAEQTKTRLGTAKQTRDLAEWTAHIVRDAKALYKLVVAEEPLNMPGRGQVAIVGFTAVLQGILRAIQSDPFLREGYAVFPRVTQIRNRLWGSRERGDTDWLLESFKVSAEVSAHIIDALAAAQFGYELLTDDVLKNKLHQQNRLEALR